MKTRSFRSNIALAIVFSVVGATASAKGPGTQTMPGPEEEAMNCFSLAPSVSTAAKSPQQVLSQRCTPSMAVSMRNAIGQTAAKTPFRSERQ
jgi:hypothetical protein